MKKIFIALIALLCLAAAVFVLTNVVSATDEIPSLVDTNVVETESTEKNLTEELEQVLIILAESTTKGEAVDKLMAMNPTATSGDILDLVDGFEEMSIFWDCRECVLYDLDEGLEYGLEAEWIEWYLDTYFPELPESCEPYEEAPADIPMVTTETVVKWAETHLEEISVIITLIATLIYQVRKHASLNKSIALCNNNAVSIVENSNGAIQTALSRVENVSAIVDKYKDEIVTLLAEIRQSAEEKKKLETALAEVENYLKTSKLANTELANEVAELLVLANIPNSKKEELYSRHRAAVDAIDAADHKKTEVKKDVGEEA